jgi:hypothetical protein
LPNRIESSVGSQRERMRRYHDALLDQVAYRLRQPISVKLHGLWSLLLARSETDSRGRRRTQYKSNQPDGRPLPNAIPDLAGEDSSHRTSAVRMAITHDGIILGAAQVYRDRLRLDRRAEVDDLLRHADLRSSLDSCCSMVSHQPVGWHRWANSTSCSA